MDLNLRFRVCSKCLRREFFEFVQPGMQQIEHDDFQDIVKEFAEKKNVFEQYVEEFQRRGMNISSIQEKERWPTMQCFCNLDTTAERCYHSNRKRVIGEHIEKNRHTKRKTAGKKPDRMMF